MTPYQHPSLGNREWEQLWSYDWPEQLPDEQYVQLDFSMSDSHLERVVVSHTIPAHCRNKSVGEYFH